MIPCTVKSLKIRPETHYYWVNVVHFGFMLTLNEFLQNHMKITVQIYLHFQCPLLLLPENKTFGIRTNISTIYTICNNQDKMFKHHNSHWFHKLYHVVCLKSEPQQPNMKLSCTIMCLGVHLKSEDTHQLEGLVCCSLCSLLGDDVHIFTHQDWTSNVDIYGRTLDIACKLKMQKWN